MSPTSTAPTHHPMRMYPKESIVIKGKSILKRRHMPVRTQVKRRTPISSQAVRVRPERVTSASPSNPITIPSTDSKPLELSTHRDDTVKVVLPNDSKHKQLKFSRHPVKVLIIESKGEYCSTVWLAIGAGLCHMCVAATCFTILMLALDSYDVHIVLCTLGYHFFIPEGILCLNYANGWSAPMRIRHKKFSHTFLNIIGVLLGIVGSICANYQRFKVKDLSRSFHSFTGHISGVFAVPCVLTGLFLTVSSGKNEKFVIFHTVLGLICFTVSTLSICSILLRLATPTTHIITGFIIYYTLFIILTCFSKCISRI